MDKDSVKLQQSRTITTIGCVGLVLVLILLWMIGIVFVRGDLQKTRSEATAALGRMKAQVEKAPGIFERIVSMGCGSEYAGDITELKNTIAAWSGDTGFGDVSATWENVESIWNSLGSSCAEFQYDPKMVDLTTEIEGVRNRYFVELGNYRQAAEVFNTKLGTFPASMYSWGFEELQTAGGQP